jgi:tetratricopeptide (TPR) repeat protein
MTRGRAAVLTGLLALLPATAGAVETWYGNYQDATEKLIPKGRYAEALKLLQRAVAIRPRPELNVRTYGMEWLDYHPYYYMGFCHLKLGSYQNAIEMFEKEERHGIIKQTALFEEFKRRRKEAQDAEQQRLASQAREAMQRLKKEAETLFDSGKHDAALAKLHEAHVLAVNLDPGLQKEIQTLRERIRADADQRQKAQERAQAIDTNLASGFRLLDEGRHTEAVVAFDRVLGIDPGNERATEGKRRAEEAIRAVMNRQKLEASLREGRALFEAGEYEKAIVPLTAARTDEAYAAAAGPLLEQAVTTLKRIEDQKRQRLTIDRLLAEGERLIEARKYPEAQVRFERILDLERDHPRAKERRDFAERMTGETLLARWMPNRPPLLNFYEPRSLVVEGSRVAIIGFATDDRGIDKVEFLVGGRVVAEQRPSSALDAPEALRNVSFNEAFPLEPGANEIVVRVVDEMGLEQVAPFRITRRLRFYETRAFLPSAAGTALGLIGLGLGLQHARRRRAVRRRFNPYIAGAPVMSDAMFFGRERLMARMLNVLHHNSLMITGERRIGKTTFLYRLKKVLAADDGTEYRFFPVFTDLQGVPEAGFFHALMSDVVDELALSPATVASLRFRRETAAYDGRDFSHDLQRVIGDLTTRTDRRVKLALLIDEVDVLNEYSEQVNQRLRGIFMKTFSEHLVAVMSGVGIKRTWKSEVSPWYNFFDEVELTAFSREEAEALIRQPVAGVFKYQGDAVEQILELSEMKPYLIQKFCVHAVNRTIEGRRTTISVADVLAVRDDVLIEGRGASERLPMETASV